MSRLLKRSFMQRHMGYPLMLYVHRQASCVVARSLNGFLVPLLPNPGICFWTKLCEFNDIDGDGNIDPILVYRIYKTPEEGEDTYDDGYTGRIRIIIFHNDTKAIIRAITGDLDGERSTTANNAYFNHLVKKMENMYHDRHYGFDNSYDFVPRREK